MAFLSAKNYYENGEWESWENSFHLTISFVYNLALLRAIGLK